MRPQIPSLLVAALVLAFGSSPAGAQARAAAAVHGRVAAEGRARIIVELQEHAIPEGWLGRSAARDQRRRIGRANARLLAALAGTDARRARPYSGVPFVSLEVGPRALAILERSPRVRAIREDRVMRPMLESTGPIVESDQAAALALDGEGQMIVVLDTGVESGHINFAPGRVVEEACFARGFGPTSPSGDCPGGGDTAFGPGAGAPCYYSDECEHGTHVAGIAAGRALQHPGVARHAQIASIQIFSEFPSLQCGGGGPCPRSYISDQDAALGYVLDTLRFEYDIAAVNMSLGGGAYDDPAECDMDNASTKALIDQLRSLGIPTVISTGNRECGGQGCTDAISAPACISSAISVAATNDADGLPSWGNRSSFVSLFAPGQNVTAPYYGTVDQYITKFGTSMAAPHVSGAWAILYQASDTLDVDTTLELLRSTGEPVEDTSRIRIRAALDSFLGGECDDGIDNDGDGRVDLEDKGCENGADPDEQNADAPCDDGLDNDGDGWFDVADPGCLNEAWFAEDPKCNDGIDNDGDGGIDADGEPPDADCAQPWKNGERGRCGLGAELALLLPPLLHWRARRARRRAR